MMLEENHAFRFRMSSDRLVEGVVTKPSKYTIEETLERLEKVIRAKGPTLFAPFKALGTVGARE